MKNLTKLALTISTFVLFIGTGFLTANAQVTTDVGGGISITSGGGDDSVVCTTIGTTTICS